MVGTKNLPPSVICRSGLKAVINTMVLSICCKYVLNFLDTLGKWSLIDTYVLTLMMVAFHIHICPLI